MKDVTEIDKMVAEAEKELAWLEARRSSVLETIKKLKEEKDRVSKFPPKPLHHDENAPVSRQSSESEKISLFRMLFKGREDAYPRRFESRRTGKAGYQPACRNEWLKGICKKPKVKCSECENREFLPLTDEVIRNHLLGVDPQNRCKDNFTIGAYPLLLDETCWFIAVDFDKTTWMEDTSAFLNVCKRFNIPASLERSRSGNGGHVWIFFSDPVPAALARKMASFMMTESMESRPEIGLNSYDRFFPNQDTLPKGGFGNLIALPLQRKPKERGNSVFVNEEFIPYPDQWAFLSLTRRMSGAEIEAIVNEAERRGRVIGVRMVIPHELDDEPWTAPPSRRRKEPPITGQLPERTTFVLENQIYIDKEGLPAPLKNRLIRLAPFKTRSFIRRKLCACQFTTSLESSAAVRISQSK